MLTRGRWIEKHVPIAMTPASASPPSQHKPVAVWRALVFGGAAGLAGTFVFTIILSWVLASRGDNEAWTWWFRLSHPPTFKPKEFLSIAEFESRLNELF